MCTSIFRLAVAYLPQDRSATGVSPQRNSLHDSRKVFRLGWPGWSPESTFELLISEISFIELGDAEGETSSPARKSTFEEPKRWR